MQELDAFVELFDEILEDEMPDGIRPSGPGKFDTLLDSVIYDLSRHGCDEEVGDVGTSGWRGLLRFDAFSKAFIDELFEEDLTNEERELLRSSAGVIILAEDSQGFVSVDYFDDEKKLAEAWEEAEAEVALAEAIANDQEEYRLHDSL